jgi:hypothetical protein
MHTVHEENISDIGTRRNNGTLWKVKSAEKKLGLLEEPFTWKWSF